VDYGAKVGMVDCVIVVEVFHLVSWLGLVGVGFSWFSFSSIAPRSHGDTLLPLAVLIRALVPSDTVTFSRSVSLFFFAAFRLPVLPWGFRVMVWGVAGGSRRICRVLHIVRLLRDKCGVRLNNTVSGREFSMRVKPRLDVAHFQRL